MTGGGPAVAGDCVPLLLVSVNAVVLLPAASQPSRLMVTRATALSAALLTLLLPV